MKFRLFLMLFLLSLPIQTLALTVDDQYNEVDTFVEEKNNNPYFQNTYQFIQNQFTRTNIDLYISSRLDSNPLIIARRPLTREALRKETVMAIQKDKIEMTRLTDQDPNPVHQEILAAFRRRFKKAGMSTDEVNNAKVFLALGDINAYTPTGRDGEHIVVLQTELVQKFLRYEQMEINGKKFSRGHIIDELIEAIFGHEIGHVQSNHVDIGVETSALMLLTAQYFASSEIADDGSVDDLNTIPHNILSSAKAIDQAYAIGFKATAAKKALGLQEDAKTAERIRALILTHVDTMINVILLNQEMDPKILEFLVQLKGAKAHSVNTKDMLHVLGQVSRLFSREWETSADLHELIHSSPFWAAAPYVMFSGSIFPISPDDPNFIPSIEYQIWQHIEDNRDMYKNLSYDQQVELLGNSSGDHPFPGARADNVIYYSKTLDIAIVQNRLAMLSATYGELKQSRLYIEQALKDPKLNSEQLAKLQKISADLTSLIKELGDAFTAFINKSGYTGATLDSNRLFTDMVDIQLARKIRNLSNQAIVQARLKTEKDHDEIVTLKSILSQIRAQFTIGDDLLQQAQTEIVKQAKGTSPFLDLITKVLDPQLTIDAARGARADVAKILGTEQDIHARRARVAVANELTDAAQSSMSRYLPTTIRGQRKDELLKIVGKAPLNTYSLATSAALNLCQRHMESILKKPLSF